MPKILRVVLNVPDFDAVVRFYRDILGFPLSGGWDRGPTDKGALVQVSSGAVIEVIGHGPSFSVPRHHDSAIAIELEDRREVHDYHDRLIAAAVAVSAPTLQPWGHFSMSLRDPVDLEIVLYCDENATIDARRMLEVAIGEARTGMAEGGVPIGAALYQRDGTLLGQGRNRRVQHDDPSAHAETDAFRNAGRQRSYRNLIMVTTLAPCWYCSGLIRQFGIPLVIIGESVTFRGGIDWLAEHGVGLIVVNSAECASMMASFIASHPNIWAEDIGDG